MIIQTEKVRLLKITENSEELSSPERCGCNLKCAILQSIGGICLFNSLRQSAAYMR